VAERPLALPPVETTRRAQWAYTSNLLLNSLPEAARRSLLAKLQAVELKQHQILFDAREAVDTVFFAIDAVVCLLVRV
jgi:hypothetical protein